MKRTGFLLKLRDAQVGKSSAARVIRRSSIITDAAGKVQRHTAQTVSPAPIKMEGLSGRWFVTDREAKVDEVLYQAINTALVKVEAPPATGKTSFMQKMCDRARQEGWGRVLECSAGNCKGEVTINSVLETSPAAKGLNWGDIYGETTPDIPADGDGGVYIDLGTLTLVCIDEAHLLFSSPGASRADVMFWANLKGLQQRAGRGRSVRVVLFVMYGDGPSRLYMTPYVSGPIKMENAVKFRQLRSEEDTDVVELALDGQEYEELWDLFIAGANFSGFFQDMALRQELLQMASGHVGIITAVMDELHKKLMNKQTDIPSNMGIGDRLIRYMFRTGQIPDCVKRVRGVLSDSNELSQLSPILTAVWAASPDGCYEEEINNTYLQHRAHSSSSIYEMEVLVNEADGLLKELLNTGYLLQTGGLNSRYYYPTPLHCSYYLTQLCPRGSNSLSLTSEEDFQAFLRHTISCMSGSALQHCYNRRHHNHRRVYERYYQAEWYRAAASLVPDNVKISPDVGKVLSCQGCVDFWIQPGIPKSDVEAEDYQLPRGWAVEVLVNGDRAQKDDVGRCGPGAVSAPLPCAQHVVIDFWTEEPKADSIRCVAETEAHYVVHFDVDFKTAKFLVAGGEEETLVLS